MLVGEIKSQIQSIWDDFWAGGLSNPLAVMEQITYLLFIKRLDEMQTMEEGKAATLKRPMERRIFPQGFDGRRSIPTSRTTSVRRPRSRSGASARAPTWRASRRRFASSWGTTRITSPFSGCGTTSR
jgi:hypothetical protein